MTNTGCVVTPPIGLHVWLPTPTMKTYRCQQCGVKVSKMELVKDKVPVSCERMRRGGRGEA